MLSLVERKNRKGKVDVLISWECCEDDSWEPMEVIKKDDPTTFTKYTYFVAFH